MRGLALTGTMLTALCAGAQAADQVKLGLMTPLSGPISPAGAETKRGVDLALEELGNKLGGLPVKYTVVDDKTNPAEAVQGASKLIDDAKVDFVTGFSSSNTMIPVWKTFNDAGVFAVGALAGPLQFAGKDCVPNGFVVSFSNDDWPAAVGKYMTDKGVKSAFFIGADYQAGDLVTWMLPGNLPHIGLVSSTRASSGRLLMVHNIGRGPQIEDVMFNYDITGRYRYRGK